MTDVEFRFSQIESIIPYRNLIFKLLPVAYQAESEIITDKAFREIFINEYEKMKNVIK